MRLTPHPRDGATNKLKAGTSMTSELTSQMPLGIGETPHPGTGATNTFWAGTSMT